MTSSIKEDGSKSRPRRNIISISSDDDSVHRPNPPCYRIRVRARLAKKVTGRLKVTKTCCQPFDVLNGGVSALISETLASLGAYMASGFRRVAGVQLSTNHLKPALLGEEVEAEARPIQAGKTIQVWEVQIQKSDPSTTGRKVLLSTSRVTLICNQQASENMKSYEETVKKYAKL